jgi:hypothetical protein
MDCRLRMMLFGCSAFFPGLEKRIRRVTNDLIDMSDGLRVMYEEYLAWMKLLHRGNEREGNNGKWHPSTACWMGASKPQLRRIETS